MRRRFKIAFVILLIATMVWSFACYQHVRAYNRMIEEKKQQVGEEFFNRFFDYPPVWVWEWSELYLLMGFFMLMVWIGFCAELRRVRICTV